MTHRSSSERVDWHARRPFVVALTLAGFVVSGYLALYQLGISSEAWDPIFGTGTERVLGSAFARGLPVPDTLLGVIAYAIEGALATVALRPGAGRLEVLAFGLLGIAMAATGIFLVAVQALVVHAWCSLCLVSAAISVVVGIMAVRELRSVVGEPGGRNESHEGVAAG